MTKLRKKYLIRTERNLNGKVCDTWKEVEEYMQKLKDKGHKSIVVYENIYHSFYMGGRNFVVDKKEAKVITWN